MQQITETEEAREKTELSVAQCQITLKNREAEIALESDHRLADLQAMLSQEESLLEQLQQRHAEMSAAKCDVEERLRQTTSDMETLQEDVSRAEDTHAEVNTEGENAREQAKRAELMLACDMERVQQLRGEHEEMTRDYAAALRQLEDAERAKAQDERLNLTVMEQLEAERRMRLAEAESFNELQAQHDEHVNVRDGEQRRAAALADKLKADRLSQIADNEHRLELQRRADELSRELERHERRVAEVTNEMQTERHKRAVNAANHAEQQGVHSQVSDDHQMEEKREVALMEELEAEKRLINEEADVLRGLEEECGALSKENAQHADMHAQTRAHLMRIQEAHNQDVLHANELRDELDIVQPARDALAGKHSAEDGAVQRLRSDIAEIIREKESLSQKLEEQRQEKERARREREQGHDNEAQPSKRAPLSVSDVLISVAFEGVAVPLELKPWDTNLDAVVSEWIANVKIKPHLKDSILRYLKHLEDTTHAFPVHVCAKLLEVHEHFAI